MKMSLGVEFVSEVVPPPEPCLQVFNSVIKGTATHLGRFEGVGSTCILDVIAPDPDPPFLAPGSATLPHRRLLEPAVGADGGQRRSSCAWRPPMPSRSSASSTIRYERWGHRILGGTGPFDGATGELHTEAINEDGQRPDDGESRGWIRY